MMNASVQEKFQIEQASDKTFAPVRQFEIRNNITVQESRIKKIHDLHMILAPHKIPSKTALAQALHGLCLDGWGMPAVDLLPYYPNGSPNDGREQTLPSEILSAFFPQYLRGKCEQSHESCPQEDSLKKTVQPARIMGISTQGYPISRLLQPQLIRQCG